MQLRRVVIYARVSTNRQLDALKNQIQECDEIAKQREEWTTIDEYVDKGKSGTSITKRKKFQKMMSDAREGKFDLIIAREISRMSRKTSDLLETVDELKKLGVEVWFVKENIWTFDPNAEIMLSVLSAIAQNESKTISWRVMAGQKISFENGVAYGNGNILGYDRCGDHYVVNVEQAETVKRIFELYLAGKSQRVIAFTMEQEGRLTAMNGTIWYTEVVGHILNNPFYCGIVIYGKQVTSDFFEHRRKKNNNFEQQIVKVGNHEPLISVEDFCRVQEIINSRSLSSKGKKIGKRCPVKIWSKKIRCMCGHCMSRIKWGKSKKDNLIMYGYRCCYGARRGSAKTRKEKGVDETDTCNVKSFGEWKLDVLIRELLKSLSLDYDKIAESAVDFVDRCVKYKEEDINQEEINKCRKDLIKISNQLNNLAKLFMSERIDLDIYDQNKNVLDTQKVDLERRLNEMESDLRDEENVRKLEWLDEVQKLKNYITQRCKSMPSDIPDTVIDAFVDKVIVKEDCYEVVLNITNKTKACFVCNVTGKRKNPRITIILKEIVTENSIDDDEDQAQST